MKKYRRFINASKYLDEDSDEILFDDEITINIDMDLISEVIEGSTNKQIVRFPGVEQFRKDVLDILENEYNFDVIEDIYNGKKQKGYCSDRSDSISIYFDTYYDLVNCNDAIKRMGSSLQPNITSGKIFCFIHLRFSDHSLYDYGDQLHLKFVSDNSKKYTQNRSDIKRVFKDECINLRESDVHMYYDEALLDLRYQLDAKIAYWARKTMRINERNKS